MLLQLYQCPTKHFRHRADETNELFAQYTASLKPNETVLKLYNEILDDLRKEKNRNPKQDINDLEKELQKIDSNISKVDDKFIQDDIDKPTHNRLIERYNNDKA